MESNQTATFWSIIDNELAVVTEDNSALNLYQIRAAKLTCKTKGESVADPKLSNVVIENKLKIRATSSICKIFHKLIELLEKLT